MTPFVELLPYDSIGVAVCNRYVANLTKASSGKHDNQPLIEEILQVLPSSIYLSWLPLAYPWGVEVEYTKLYMHYSYAQRWPGC